jgi:hypothetical protein
MRHTPLLVALLLLPLTGCSESDAPAGSAEPASSSTSETTAEPEQEEPAPPAITIGDRAYVPPCALLPPAEATRLLPLRNGAEVTERGRAAPVTAAELADRKGTVAGTAITTSCDYSIGDADKTVAKLQVLQFPTEKAAVTTWRRDRKYGTGALPPDLRDNNGAYDALEQATVDLIKGAQESLGGVRLRGVDERILWQQGERAFIATTGNLLLGFTRGKSYGLTDDLGERDARLADRVLTTALDRAQALQGEDAEPAVASTGQIAQADDWPRFLDPCALLDTEAMDLLFPGVALEEVTSDSTPADPDSYLTLDSFAGRSVQNSCARESVDGRRNAELLVQYVAPGDRPKQVLDSYLSQLAFSDPRPSPEQVRTIRGALRDGGMFDVDSSYVLASTGGGMYFYAIWDRYVVQLEAKQAKQRRGRKPEPFPELEPLDSYTLMTAMDVVMAHAREDAGVEE